MAHDDWEEWRMENGEWRMEKVSRCSKYSYSPIRDITEIRESQISTRSTASFSILHSPLRDITEIRESQISTRSTVSFSILRHQ